MSTENDSVNTDKSSSPVQDTIVIEHTDPCPANEYGNHDWNAASCIEPAQCRDCNIYRDNKLATHHDWHEYDSGRKCDDCNLSYTDYNNEK